MVEHYIQSKAYLVAKNTATIFVYRISGTKFGEKRLGSGFELKILNLAGKQKFEVFLKVFGYSSI